MLAFYLTKQMDSHLMASLWHYTPAAGSFASGRYGFLNERSNSHNTVHCRHDIYRKSGHYQYKTAHVFPSGYTCQTRRYIVNTNIINVQVLLKDWAQYKDLECAADLYSR